MVTGPNSTVFNELDLLNEKTENKMKLLYTPAFKELEFYRAFNKEMQSG
jgi:hypothetical protein